MQVRHRGEAGTVRTEGAILPPDLLERVRAGDRDLGGLTPSDYHLDGERLNEVISRSWTHLVSLWDAFKSVRESLPEQDFGTGPTRERWLLPLFQELGYGRLQTSKAIELEGKSYAISHSWGQVPIQLAGFRVHLDRRIKGVAGAARMSPHGLAQELLNRSDDFLWAFVSNGLRLRILRDNTSLTRQAYVEFDLEAMFEGEAYADFSLLWLVCHQSRVEGEKPEEFWLEKWSRAAQEQGTRALDELRAGVEEAITALGRGFLAHPDNKSLWEALRSGALDKQDYYRQLLRLVYRLIFLFVAEDRGLLFAPASEAQARERYLRFYSTAHLRRLAERRLGTRHPDLYETLKLVAAALGRDEGCPELALPGLGSFLWSAEAIADLKDCALANHDLLDAVRRLCFTTEKNIRRAVDYRNLGPEELGSVYEALLELQPEVNVDAAAFELKVVGGSERKTTGSYYTPSSLISCLLDSALNPVVDEALKAENPEQALLDLKVCDPACGSGHFLVAAAHRIARHLASVRTGDPEPSPEATRHSLRDVISHCIHGVDINPMAVELCKVNLWLEALEPGKPLSFLDHKIQCGNSLLGATPELIAQGIPDEAFTPIEGDDKKFTASLKKQNKQERTGQTSMFDRLVAEERADYSTVASAVDEVEHIDEDTVEAVRLKQERYRQVVEGDAYRMAKLVADAWCAAFVWRKTRDAPPAVTESVFRKLKANPIEVPQETILEIQRLAEEYQFFQWHLGFPGVFGLPNTDDAPPNEQTGWNGGFHCVVGNPPWERVKIEEKEWFAGRNDQVASARNKATRGKLIQKLKDIDPSLYAEFWQARREAEGTSHLLRRSSLFPLCGHGDVNTYSVFAELALVVLVSRGMAGMIVPDTIAISMTTSIFMDAIIGAGRLKSFYGFKNERFLFGGIEHTVTFALMTCGGRSLDFGQVEFCWLAWTVEEMKDERRRVKLGPEDVKLFNPNTRTCPIFMVDADARIAKGVYSRVPVMVDKGRQYDPWGIDYLTMFHMANDSGLFLTRSELAGTGFELSSNIFEKGGNKCLPLYEAKMIHQFDHRYASYEGREDERGFATLPPVSDARHQDPEYAPLPYYWVESTQVATRLRSKGWNRGWLVGFRDIARNTDIRTAIFAMLPAWGFNNKVPLIVPVKSPSSRHSACLVANLNSIVFDYLLRQKHGGTSLSYFILEQVPVLPPASYDESHLDFITKRVLELAYTAWHLQAFARDVGYLGPPLAWDSQRRTLLRSELDALFALLYGLRRNELRYILDPAADNGPEFPGETFRVLKASDMEAFGEYRTARLILEIYDEMQQAIATEVPYRTRLDPPPADPRVAHQPL